MRSTFLPLSFSLSVSLHTRAMIVSMNKKSMQNIRGSLSTPFMTSPHVLIRKWHVCTVSRLYTKRVPFFFLLLPAFNATDCPSHSATSTHRSCRWTFLQPSLIDRPIAIPNKKNTTSLSVHVGTLADGLFWNLWNPIPFNDIWRPNLEVHLKILRPCRDFIIEGNLRSSLPCGLKSKEKREYSEISPKWKEPINLIQTASVGTSQSFPKRHGPCVCGWKQIGEKKKLVKRYFKSPH